MPTDSVRRIAEVGREVARIGARYGESIWPGFRPDTIPLSFVFPSRGDVLLGWGGALPADYAPIAGIEGAAWRDQKALGAASTAINVNGKRVAQIVVSALDPAMLAATAVHEAFHVFEGASRRPDRKFGQGENSMLVSSYPVFDERNEVAFALEGKLLAAALAARSQMERRALAQQFVTVRRERHRALTPQFAEFDQLSELNEGLAEYALVRAMRLMASEGPVSWRASATRHLAARLPLLERLTESENLSLRFRFYQTGPAQALLLDDLMGATWKPRMLAANTGLQDMLAIASAVDSIAVAARAIAERTTVSEKLQPRVASQIERLKSARRAKADSLLAKPGVQLLLVADSLPGKDFNSCGYDPQNLLQVTGTMQIQTRWWRPCAGGPTSAEFNVPSIHDQEAGTVRAVIGDDAELRLTSNGAPIIVRDGETVRDVRAFKLEAPRASVDAVRADITRAGRVLEIHPKRAP